PPRCLPPHRHVHRTRRRRGMRPVRPANRRGRPLAMLQQREQRVERNEMATEPLPVTGAWRPGDPPGHRRFFTFAADRPFAVESGATLRDVTVAYQTWGELDARGSNAVLVCHAWTGDSHAAGRATTGHPAPGWWDEVVGPGKH